MCLICASYDGRAAEIVFTGHQGAAGMLKGHWGIFHHLKKIFPAYLRKDHLEI